MAQNRYAKNDDNIPYGTMGAQGVHKIRFAIRWVIAIIRTINDNILQWPRLFIHNLTMLCHGNDLSLYSRFDVCRKLMFRFKAKYLLDEILKRHLPDTSQGHTIDLSGRTALQLLN